MFENHNLGAGESERHQMAESVKELISLGDDLVHVLKNQDDLHNLTYSVNTCHSLRSSSSDLSQARASLQDCERKVEACRKKTADAKSETVTDAELQVLQRDLDDVAKLEQLLLEELSTVIGGEMDELEAQRAAVSDKKKVSVKQKHEELKAQRKLSMYASVTNIIPNLDDQSRIMGYVVDRGTKAVRNFEFDREKINSYETCNSIWKMITPS